MVGEANGYQDWVSNLQKCTVLCLFFPVFTGIATGNESLPEFMACGNVGGISPPTAAISDYSMDICVYSGRRGNYIQKNMFATNILGKSWVTIKRSLGRIRDL